MPLPQKCPWHHVVGPIAQLVGWHPGCRCHQRHIAVERLGRGVADEERLGERVHWSCNVRPAQLARARTSTSVCGNKSRATDATIS